MTQTLRKTQTTPPHRQPKPDRGSTSIEMIGYTAIMLLALMVGVQTCIWGLAELACRYAASHALQTTRVDGGTAAAGTTDADTILKHINTTLVTDAEITASRNATTATITVKGTALPIIPFLRLPVGITLSAPVETLAGEGHPSWHSSP